MHFIRVDCHKIAKSRTLTKEWDIILSLLHFEDNYYYYYY